MSLVRAPFTPVVRNADTAVANWLFVCCAMVFAMVVLGGVTRLTGSGLSMVDWQPVYGVLPPLGEAEWNALFRQYQDSPEFRTINFWMTVADFKSIFWFEYIHRLWGRLIGVAFLLPFLYFLARGWLGLRLVGRLVVAFALGGAQGLLGWYMVRSGLVERPEVSQFRLAAHLGLAFLIYGYMMWIALGLRGPPPSQGEGGGILIRLGWIAVAWIFVTAISGSLVAGIDAGYVYNTFPLMDGRIAPAGYWEISPMDFFENAAVVQFNHRVVSILLVLFLIGIWSRSLHPETGSRACFVLSLLAAMAVVQAGLGVTTLLSQVAIPAAAGHQAGALILFSLAIWAVHELRRSAAYLT